MHATLTVLLLGLGIAAAQSSCSIATSSAKYAAPSVAPGYTARIVANGLQKPRSIMFDSAGKLLVVESGKGITVLTLNDAGGECVGVSQKDTVISDTSLNHGIEMSKDGKTLYASNADKAFRWAYDPASSNVSGDATVLVQGMDHNGHTTRTLLLSKKVSDLLVISRGSADNVDPDAENINSGVSQLRSFSIGGDAKLPYDYSSQGTRLGWGLRNSVGVAEHPISGGIYSVENSADNINRLGSDIHLSNPGEELNFHGYLNGTKANPDVTGKSFGYPRCYAAWNATEIPNAGGLKTGQQFQIGQSPKDNDCTNDINPTLTFPAHWAPLDIKYNTAGTVAWITSHGSWNTQPPSGYLLYAVPFRASGAPVAASDSQSSWTPILSNPDNTACPNGCFRPVGLAWDSQGRLFMSSDSTGEIYVITATNGTGVDGLTVTPTGTSAGTSTSRPGAAVRARGEINWGMAGGLMCAVAAMLAAV